MIQERHGPITDLVMCKDSFQAANELSDETKTLADCGIEGLSKHDDPPAVCFIYYDFRSKLQEPLLLEPWMSYHTLSLSLSTQPKSQNRTVYCARFVEEDETAAAGSYIYENTQLLLACNTYEMCIIKK